MIHNYIIYVTYNRKSRLYLVRMAEVIIPQEQSESKGTFVARQKDQLEAEEINKYDPYFKVLEEPLITATVPFYIEKLAD